MRGHPSCVSIQVHSGIYACSTCLISGLSGGQYTEVRINFAEIGVHRMICEYALPIIIYLTYMASL